MSPAGEAPPEPTGASTAPPSEPAKAAKAPEAATATETAAPPSEPAKAAKAPETATATGTAESRPTEPAGTTEPAKPAEPSAAAPLTPEDRPAEESAKAAQPAPATGPRRVGLLLVVAAVAYLLDLGSKMLVVAKLENGPGVEVVGKLLRLYVIRNAGAAFSMGQALTVFLTLIAVVVIVVIARMARRLRSLPWAIALGLLLGGALGNLTDRIFRKPGVFRGEVVDFIAPAHYAVFNLADTAIVCGGILVVLLSFRGLNPDGTRHRD
ncbi:signal peptidase II [Streptomyces sp. NPDC059740]|uniref:signal peptidase II n=1 Tax=Streptomyces sp. NPDC059740 TaxID=3346926 RepID=UPI00365AAF36